MSDLEKSEGQSMEEILASIRSSVDTSESHTGAAHPGASQNSVPPTSQLAPAAQPPLPSAARNGGGRLQDALSQIAVASSLNAARPHQSVATPPPAPSEHTGEQSAPPAPLAIGDETLDDLFEPAPDPIVAPNAQSGDEANPVQPFGSAPAQQDAVEQSPASVESAVTDPAKEPDLTVAQTAPPSETPKSDISIAPVRTPDFSKLNALATGATVTQPQPNADNAKSDVLLPEMRNMAGTNPVAEMHSMAAAMGAHGSKPGAAIQDDVETEIVAAPSASDTDTAPSSDKRAGTPQVATETSDTVSGGRTLEDIVADLLKPQLERWLEANMPRIVERALRAEQKGPTGQDSS